MPTDTSGSPGPDLSGLRILVVEDTLLIAELIADELQSFGCEVVGPVAHLQKALEMAGTEQLSGAFLDVNLAGEPCFPIARKLSQRGVPYVFITGYDDVAALPAEYRDMPRVAKPFDPGKLPELANLHFSR